MDDLDELLELLVGKEEIARTRRVRSIIESAFLSRGIPVPLDHCCRFLDFVREPPRSALYGEKIAAVEAVRKAAQLLRRSIVECEKAAREQVSADERNVAEIFCRWLADAEWREEVVCRVSLDDIVNAADRAITAGPVRQRGRPAGLLYDSFIAYTEEYLQNVGFSTEITRREGQYVGEFIGVVADLEKILPQPLRAGRASAVAERIVAARARRGE